ncbi:MAG: SAM-dependent methyltransferase [Sphingomonadales bacterium]
MSRAGNRKAATAEADIPFSVRLKAWWEGYDPSDLWATMQITPVRNGKEDIEATKVANATVPLARDGKAEAPRRMQRPTMPWDEKRVETAQFVWGKGYCGPGGPKHVVAMSKLLALSPEMSVLALGAELGGPARTLAKEYGAWISGYEQSEELVEAGNRLSEAAGLSKKAKLQHYDFKKPKPFNRQFDRVFSKEALFTVKEKADLFKAMEQNIKGDGLVLLTDYVLGKDSDLKSREIIEWRKQEPNEPHLVTAEQLISDIKDAQLSIRVNEDVTEQYIKLIANSWNKADRLVAELVARGEDGEGMVETLLHEAELWSRRSRLLESGKLKLWRVVAHKKVLNSLMSNW